MINWHDVVYGTYVLAVLLHRPWSSLVGREDGMQKFAEAEGFQYGSDHFPESFPLPLYKSVLGWGKTRHLVTGYREQDTIMAFDVIVGARWDRRPVTVVARRSEKFDCESNFKPRRLEEFRLGEWRMVVPKKTYLPFNLLLEPKDIQRIWAMLA